MGGIGAACAVYLWITPIYTVGVTFTGAADPTQLEHQRMVLLNCAWSDADADRPYPRTWDIPRNGALRMEMRGSDRKEMSRHLQRVADRFIYSTGVFSGIASATGGSPDATAPLAGVLDEQLAEATVVAEAACRGSSGSDPDEELDVLVDELNRRKAELETIRSRWSDLSARLAAHESAPLPGKGWVDPVRREQAIQAHLELQQDRAERQVHLAAIRRQLLDGWQRTSPALDDLLSCIGALRRLPADETVRKADPSVRRIVEQAIDPVNAYHDRVGQFTQEWTKLFTGLQHTPVESLSTDVLETCQAVNRMLGDFAFDSEALLEKIRKELDPLCRQPKGASGARHFSLQTDFTRAVSQLASAQSAFERAAATLKRGDNFRLDAALQAAAGLDRRVRHYLAAVERDLEAEAVEQARREHQQMGREMKAEAARLRILDENAVSAMFVLHDRLLSYAEKLEPRIEARTACRLFEERVADLTCSLEDWEARTHSNETGRSTGFNDAVISAGPIHVSSRPINQLPRLGLAALAGLFVGLSLHSLLPIRT